MLEERARVRDGGCGGTAILRVTSKNEVLICFDGQGYTERMKAIESVSGPVIFFSEI
jgi:hypothetical protein